MIDKLKAALDWFANLPQMLRVGVVCALLGFILGGVTCRAWRKNVIETEPPAGMSFGWVDKPSYVESLVATFRRPFFGDAAKPLIQGDTDKDAFLWQAYEKVTGHPWVPHDQNGVGSCVGHGASAAVEILSCVESSLNMDNDEYKPMSAAAIYALSREVGDFLGNQDGSTGADAAKALMTLGIISCEEAGDDNSDTKIGPPLCKKWGRTGLPSDKRTLAASHKVKTASRIRTPEEARAALVNGYPLTLASSVGFEPFKRDADGFCKSGGSWPHQMACAAYRKDKKAFLILQSWGPTMPPGPKSLGQPDGSFWISWRDMQRIITSGEVYALSGHDGYPKRELPLWIHRPLPRRDMLAARGRTLDYSLAP